jgi:hypothetical protein
MECILQEFKPWALNSAGKKLTRKIERDSIYITAFILSNLILTLLATTSHFIPVDNDEEVFFAFYFFPKYVPQCGIVLNWIYRSTFFVVGFVMVICNYQFIYYIQHIKFQLSMLWQHGKCVTDLIEYNNTNDCDLLKITDFQCKVEARLKFCVKRHGELLQ